MKRAYLTAKEVEEKLTALRTLRGYETVTEIKINEDKVEEAKAKRGNGDKTIISVNPILVHIPEWQRMLNVRRAEDIGKNYDPYKWELPKVVYKDGLFIVIDGMHRLYGAAMADMRMIQVEVLVGITEERAINLFLDQGKDRGRMTLQDSYGAAIEAGRPEYIRLKEICDKNHVAIKGDQKSIKNPVGLLTSISDGLRLARSNPELLDRILQILGKLQWNAGKSIHEGKAYSAKVIRVFNKLYAYYAGKEDRLEEILINNCKGSTYFNTNISDKWQDTLFDFLSGVIEKNINIPTIGKKRTTRRMSRTA